MSKTTLGFIFSGIAYLLLGVALGVLFTVFPGTRKLVGVHAHLNLVGFVIFLIFGIGYHILPRFRGRPLHSETLAWWQFCLANAGLAGLLVSMGLDAYLALKALQYAQTVFGALLAFSVFMFAYNMLRTLVPPVPQVKR